VSDVPFIGEFFALGAAVVWATAVILFRRSGETTPPFALNLFRVGVSSVLLVGLMVALGNELAPERPWTDYLLLTLSGWIGIALSDTLFHRCLNMVGAGINAVVDCLYSPFTAILAFLVLKESLGLLQIAGLVLVVSGVLLTVRAVPPEGTSRRDLVVGIGWGVLAMFTLALGVILAKPVLEGTSVLWVTTVRQVASLALMAPVALAMRDRAVVWSVFIPRAHWRFTLPGTILGSFVALLFWLAGMKYAMTGVAAVLNQTSTIFLLFLAWLILGEPFTGRRWAAAGLALAGIALVMVG
jgi:drug/metabolite transporter (DMT)-like permease